MIVGIPKEIKDDEARVAVVPSGVTAFVAHGHTVLVERGCGVGSGIPDEHYVDAGATLLDDPKDLWARADLVMKVKEPVGPELARMRPGQILYTYLHLASSRSLTQALLDRRVTGVAYETVQLEDGSLPLLRPMSEVAGRLAVQEGARHLEAPGGGMGILLSGVAGVRPAYVAVLGGGVAGANACQVALGMGAQVSVIDVNARRLGYLRDVMGPQLTTLMSNSANITEELRHADLVIGTVLVPGAKAPKLISRSLIGQMKPGSVLVDVAIDQGGCADTSHPTTHHAPTFIVDGVVHYCVANMPGAVPRTSTYALTNVTLGHGLAMAGLGLDAAMARDPALARGLNTHDGEIRHPGVAAAFEGAG
ncbi:MAG: alanine dehydrogenase [Candidatus Hydrogenedentes bacterium]|nr:alanine dehydrogenase [Candidatus Hydrogenedentota bacterium]